MGFLATSPVYDGPQLSSPETFEAWKTSFLSAADALGLRGYFTETAYDDPYLADHISAAKRHLLESRAEFTEPDIANDLSGDEFSKAIQRRKRRVKERVTAAIATECASLRARTIRFARQYLLSALTPALRESVGCFDAPSAMWSLLEDRAASTMSDNDAFSHLRAAMEIKYERGEVPSRFFGRFEAATSKYIACMCPGDTAMRDYCTAISDRMRIALLSSALPPHLKDEFGHWHAGRWEYARVKQHVEYHLQSWVTDDARVYCHYCHSKKHTDSVCAHLHRARRDGIVRSDYELPHGEVFPTELVEMSESARRFCTYCQSTKHNDTACAKLAADTAHDCVRANYAPPPKHEPADRTRAHSISSLENQAWDEPAARERLRPMSNEEVEVKHEAVRRKRRRLVRGEDERLKDEPALNGDTTESSDSSDDEITPWDLKRVAATSWTAEETSHLLQLVQEHGKKWATVLAKGKEANMLLPHRTTSSIQTKYARCVASHIL
ncbi:hypothetical protein ACHHYP_08938 [Achlya hypogyna]|uniref:Myb-like domain-containing protein n=1 Tax=Achlya hypogyna TaxID=1202772 RepID=A0A1V9ZJS5_ACHHY|nr:hypothetical protein ACHHYP_08938 [Achlya hypogyna]